MRARTRRLYTFGIAALLLLAAAVLAFFALRENANLFYTPEILAEQGQPEDGKVVKVGGWVEPGSLAYSEDGATMIFTVIDNSPTRSVSAIPASRQTCSAKDRVWWQPANSGRRARSRRDRSSPSMMKTTSRGN